MVETAGWKNPGLSAVVPLISSRSIKSRNVQTVAPRLRARPRGPWESQPSRSSSYRPTPWDAAGAKAFGYRVCWCNRSGAPADDLEFGQLIVIASPSKKRAPPPSSYLPSDHERNPSPHVPSGICRTLLCRYLDKRPEATRVRPERFATDQKVAHMRDRGHRSTENARSRR